MVYGIFTPSPNLDDMSQLNMDLLDKIKRLAVIAMISDDTLMETFIFKGGSAIGMIYDLSGRASLDLDFSMEEGLSEDEEKDIAQRVEDALRNTFIEAGFVAHDIKFLRRPRNMADAVKDFWGGYQIAFKVIPVQKAKELDYDPKKLAHYSLAVGKRNSTKFKIDISSYEYCAAKATEDFEDYNINVYSPEMIVFEKLRAICQQNERYDEIVRTNRRPRSRDFYDIFILMDEFSIDPSSAENKELIGNIFAAKRVPLGFIKQIENDKAYHQENFETSLKDTITRQEDLQGFDFYFNFVVDTFCSLQF